MLELEGPTDQLTGGGQIIPNYYYRPPNFFSPSGIIEDNIFSTQFLLILGNVLTSEVEEARLLLDTADRARRHVDSEVADVREAMSTGEF